MNLESSKYGGFFIRLAAFIIDKIILSVLFSPMLFFYYQDLLKIGSPAPGTTQQEIMREAFNFDVFFFISMILFNIIVWLYFALFESSKWQATIGKRLLNLQVTDYNNNRISFGRATGRYFSKIISTLIFYFGFFMIMWTSKKQGLHDKLAKTLVIRR